MLVGRSLRRHGRHRWPSISSSPAVGSSKPASMRSSVVLPQPEGPSSEKNSPRRMSKRDIVDRLHRPEVLGDALRSRSWLSLAMPSRMLPACWSATSAAAQPFRARSRSRSRPPGWSCRAPGVGGSLLGKRSWLQMNTGSVWSVPLRKKAITNSSNEMMKHSSRLATMPGSASGKVTRQNVIQALSPRSARLPPGSCRSLPGARSAPAWRTARRAAHARRRPSTARAATSNTVRRMTSSAIADDDARGRPAAA